MSTCSGNCSSCASACNDKLKKRQSLIKHKLMVLSGKGGVGKSTVAALLALSLAKKGKKVGLLDVDFHGPSQPTLFGIQDERCVSNGESLLPFETQGIKLFSIGLAVDDSDKAIVWRGPAKIAVLKQLLEEVEWGELDYLILDFPPGTGDEVLSACQMLEGDKGAVIVTTPQEVSLADCRKCLDFCEQVETPVIGIIENMSYFVCPDCHHKHAIFSNGGGRRMAESSGIPLLAQMPLDPEFLQACDAGKIADGLEHSESIRNAIREAVSVLE